MTSVDCGLHVAPGPHWANEGALLKERTGWDHFSIFNASLIHERYSAWVQDALRGLGVTHGRVGVDRVSWVVLDAFRASMPEIEFVNAEEALLLERIVKNEEEPQADAQGRVGRQRGRPGRPRRASLPA